MSSNGQRRQINVEINVNGPVVDSEIVGVSFLKSDRNLTINDRLFSRVFFEYLNLPTLAEVGARIDRALAGHRLGRIREFDFDRHGLEYLWLALLQDSYWMAEPSSFTVYGGKGYWEKQHGNHITAPGRKPSNLRVGQWLRLRNVQLSSFVNRCPGKFFRGGWDFHSGHDELDSDRFTVSTHMWTWEDYAVRTIGIGDVRLGEISGFHFMQAMSRKVSDLTSVGIMKSQNDDGSHFAGGAAISALGFPVLVDRKIVEQSAPFLDDYGAVFFDRLDAKLMRASDDRYLLWAPGVPKVVLVVYDRAAVGEARVPHPNYNAIWTIAANDDMKKMHYCTWGFRTGVKNYRQEIQRAVEVIRTATNERSLSPVFEFDAETNWFGENTMFRTTDILSLSRKLRRNEMQCRAADLVTYAAQYDTLVGRHCHTNFDTRDLISRGIAYMDYDDTKAALSCFEKAKKVCPDNPFVTDKLAACNYLQRRPEIAVQLWKQALQQKPDWELRERIEKILSQLEVNAKGE